jgi:hypothetical protein
MGSLVMAIVAARLWGREDMPCWYHTQASAEHAHETEQDVAEFWRMVAQPILFGIIGTAVDFNTLSPSSMPKALAVIALGVAFRLPTASAVTFGAGLNTKERCEQPLHSCWKNLVIVCRSLHAAICITAAQALHRRGLAGKSHCTGCPRIRTA